MSEYDDNDTDIHTAIREYLKDTLEYNADVIDSYDEDELWGEMLDWLNWLTSRLASQECKIERLECVLFDDEDEDEDLEDDDELDEDDIETEIEDDDLDCEADE